MRGPLSIGCFSVCEVNAITAFLFPIMAAKLGTGTVFAIYAAATLLSVPFFRKSLVETRGKYLEEIERIVLTTS